jgi:DNA-binding transcriptional regulator YiaG
MDKRRILRLRERFGISQAKFSRAIGVANPMTISHWETGIRTPQGPTQRFLTFLEKLPNADFKKATSLLKKLDEEENTS